MLFSHVPLRKLGERQVTAKPFMAGHDRLPRSGRVFTRRKSPALRKEKHGFSTIIYTRKHVEIKYTKLYRIVTKCEKVQYALQ
jgi:hypothetical protein